MGIAEAPFPLCGRFKPKMDRKVILLLLAFCVCVSQQEKIKKKYRKYTESTTGCPCWWDLTNLDGCACCKEVNNKKVIQCGYPAHMYCYEDKKKGCPDVPKSEHTLSTKGMPCYFENGRSGECAWCVKGKYQCEEAGKPCDKKGATKKCDGVIGDCRHIQHMCDPNASCVQDGKFGPKDKHDWYKCVCNDGFTGNGIQCFDSEGNLSVGTDEEVKVSVSVNSDYYVYPYTSEDFPLGPQMDNLVGQMNETAETCSIDLCEVNYQGSP